MSEGDDIAIVSGSVRSLNGGSNSAAVHRKPNLPKPIVAFHRTELDQILRLYGRMVASGEWRDYAIGHGTDKAIFAIFRRASEMPLYRIEKDPKLARKQGAYCVVGTGGVILKRGHELANVLKVLEKKKHLRVVE
ncbi:DUF2794 domain-containing protein [Pseudovibrio ascidiaceicola]|uniref:DUF2794 domain-containing protein n=1 Tax=Pseudovibrio ascidiaceicola TaxID=285279 RepID=UPI001AD9025E|nr:DUF2794 domain-containing protein [Pseudovibrio ascidiaceicola]